jgi:hypothetical protein
MLTWQCMGKCADYKFTYFISFTLVIPSLIKSITVCIVILMVGSSLLLFGLSFSHITFKCRIYTFSPLNISFSTFRNYNSLSANEVESLLLQLAHWIVIPRNVIRSETVGKRAVYKFTYIILFGSVIVTLMKSITVCIVVLMVCSSFLFFGLPLSQNTL